MIWKLFSKTNKCELFSPVKGKAIDLNMVNDPVFNQKMMGEGIAFTFETEEIFSPCDGTVKAVALTKHAIGIKSKNGAEILIHVGLDTCNLNGQGFELKVKQNDKIKKGQLLMKIDQNYIKSKGIDLTTPMVITNSTNYDIEIIKKGTVDKSCAVISCIKKND